MLDPFLVTFLIAVIRHLNKQLIFACGLGEQRGWRNHDNRCGSAMVMETCYIWIDQEAKKTRSRNRL